MFRPCILNSEVWSLNEQGHQYHPACGCSARIYFICAVVYIRATNSLRFRDSEQWCCLVGRRVVLNHQNCHPTRPVGDVIAPEATINALKWDNAPKNATLFNAGCHGDGRGSPPRCQDTWQVKWLPTHAPAIPLIRHTLTALISLYMYVYRRPYVEFYTRASMTHMSLENMNFKLMCELVKELCFLYRFQFIY